MSDREIEWLEKTRKKNKRVKRESPYDGSFEASRGDYEGACLARAEYEAGQIS
jgi:hypothetical protein